MILWFVWLLAEMGCCAEMLVGMKGPFLGQICWALCVTSVTHLCSLPLTQPGCDACPQPLLWLGRAQEWAPHFSDPAWSFTSPWGCSEPRLLLGETSQMKSPLAVNTKLVSFLALLVKKVVIVPFGGEAWRPELSLAGL